MRYLVKVSVLLIGLGVLFGCDQFFGSNMFGTIDDPEPIGLNNLVRSLEEADSADTIERLQHAVQNKNFFTDLKASMAAAELAGEETNDVIKILDFLKGQYLDTEGNKIAVTAENRVSVQNAALLSADVSINTSLAEATIKNVSELIVAATSDNDSPDYINFDTTEDVVRTMIPASARPPATAGINSPETAAAKAEFVSLVASLQSAGDAYSAFGSSMIVDIEVIAPDGINMGEVAQSAFVAVFVDTIIYNIADNNALPEGVTASDALFELVFFPEETGVSGPIWTDVPDTSEPVMVTNPMDAAFAEEGLKNILSASGLLDLLEGMFNNSTDEDQQPLI
jgi:hypothetical protein